MPLHGVRERERENLLCAISQIWVTPFYSPLLPLVFQPILWIQFSHCLDDIQVPPVVFVVGFLLFVFLVVVVDLKWKHSLVIISHWKSHFKFKCLFLSNSQNSEISAESPTSFLSQALTACREGKIFFLIGPSQLSRYLIIQPTLLESYFLTRWLSWTNSFKMISSWLCLLQGPHLVHAKNSSQGLS